MASIDKAAIAFSIAITAIGVGIAISGSSGGFGPAATTPYDSSDVMMGDKTIMDDEMAEKKAMMEMAEKKAMMEMAGPQTHTVDMPAGTSVAGCEQTNECYIPEKIVIDAGDTVEWINSDTAAHTVTGGSPAAGLSGVFDSRLVMVDATYAFTFDEAGSYDYFCAVHPWMIGSVTVN